MAVLSPALSERTPLASLSGWTLILRCPKCGERRKPMDALAQSVRISRPIGEIIPRLSCDHCQSKPTEVVGVCTWMANYGRQPEAEYLTFLLDQKAAT